MRLTPGVQTVNRTFSLKTIQLSAAFGSAVMMLILLDIYRYQGGLGERVQHFLQGVYPKTQKFSTSEALPVSAIATDLQVQPVPTKPDAEIRMQSFDADRDCLPIFPGKPSGQCKKILANNPMLDNKGRIYPGQELIIPYAGGS